jgi:DNA-binding CsgD family transcriptional regulator
MEVASLVIEGHSSKEIGRLLAISPLTVAKHRRDIFRLLSVRSAAQLCRQARSGNGTGTLTE